MLWMDIIQSVKSKKKIQQQKNPMSPLNKKNSTGRPKNNFCSEVSVSIVRSTRSAPCTSHLPSHPTYVLKQIP